MATIDCHYTLRLHHMDFVRHRQFFNHEHPFQPRASISIASAHVTSSSTRDEHARGACHELGVAPRENPAFSRKEATGIEGEYQGPVCAHSMLIEHKISSEMRSQSTHRAPHSIGGRGRSRPHSIAYSVVRARTRARVYARIILTWWLAKWLYFVFYVLYCIMYCICIMYCPTL